MGTRQVAVASCSPWSWLTDATFSEEDKSPRKPYVKRRFTTQIALRPYQVSCSGPAHPWRAEVGRIVLVQNPPAPPAPPSASGGGAPVLPSPPIWSWYWLSCCCWYDSLSNPNS